MSDNTQQIVEEVKNELADERFIGDKVLLSRRELVGLAAGSATVAGILGHETGTASAESSGTGRLGDPTPLEYVGADSLDTDVLSGSGIRERDGLVVVDDSDHSDLGAAANDARSQYPNQREWKIAPGTYTVTTALDFTGLDRLELDLRGARLDAETAGDPVIDFAAGRFQKVYGGIIVGQSTNTPSCGFLQARNDTGSSVGNAEFFSVDVAGDFTASAMYIFGAEETTHFGCGYLNDAGNAVIVSADNVESVTSPYETVSTSSHSMNGAYFHGGKLRCRAGDTISAALHARAADSVIVRDMIIMSDGGEHIHLDTSLGNLDYFTLEGGRFHSTGGSYGGVGIRLDGGGFVDGMVVEQVMLQAAGRVMIEAADTGIRGNFRFHPGKYGSGDAPQFNGTVCSDTSTDGYADVRHLHVGPLTDDVLDLSNGSLFGEIIVPGDQINGTANLQSGTLLVDSTGRNEIA